MEILRPDSLQEALELKAAHPAARPIAGGTDLMVELDFDRTRPQEVLDLTRVAELTGSAGPTPIRAAEAEAFVAGVLDDEGLWESRAPLSGAAVKEFGALVEAAARPIDDVRGTAAYRHHALGVLGRRTLQWAWNQYRGGGQA